MNLNNEKLHLKHLAWPFRQFLRILNKSSSPSGTRNAIIEGRIEDWVSRGKHLIPYDSMDGILEELDLTADELGSYCSRTFGKSFRSWRKELRIREAKQLLLEHPDVPASHIGRSVGITDKSNFRQQFRSLTGLTPTQWRRKHLKK